MRSSIRTSLRVGGNRGRRRHLSDPGRWSSPSNCRDSNVTKKVSLAFRDAYQKVNNAPTTDAFSAYSFDGWLVLVDAAKRALAKAQPGTPEFRQAFKEAMITTNEVVGTPWRLHFQAG